MNEPTTNGARVRVRIGDNERVLSAVAFAEEVFASAGRDFAGAPDGPVVVEYLGADGRVHWQAHRRAFSQLVPLARELLEEETGGAGRV